MEGEGGGVRGREGRNRSKGSGMHELQGWSDLSWEGEEVLAIWRLDCTLIYIQDDHVIHRHLVYALWMWRSDGRDA